MSILDLQSSQQPMEVQQLAARMKQVQDELLKQTPQLNTALVDIHKNLIQHEELVHLLDDDDIAMIHQAHEKHKQFVMIQREIEKPKSKKKLTKDDLNNL